MNDIQASLKGAVDDAVARSVAIGGLVAIALIHILQAPAAFRSIGYLGAAFIVAIVISLALAAILARTSDDMAWAAAGGFAFVVLLLYIISHSIGLPGFTEDIGEWTETLGLASMVAETFMVFLSGAVLASRHYSMPSRAARSASGTTGGMQAGPAVG